MVHGCRQRVWMRSKGKLSDDQILHRYKLSLIELYVCEWHTQYAESLLQSFEIWKRGSETI
jgi:acyl-CoA thioesterase